MVRVLFIAMLPVTAKEMKPVRVAYLGALIVMLAATAIAQEYPQAELGFDYSYAGSAPSASHTQGHGMNAGSGAIKVNLNPYSGILADLQGYASNKASFTTLNTFLAGGGSAKRTSCTQGTTNFLPASGTSILWLFAVPSTRPHGPAEVESARAPSQSRAFSLK
jgi:hypothetical protein